mgnify:CR=1 FL=1
MYAGSPPSPSGFEMAYNTSWVMDWGLLWWKGIDVYVNMPGPMLEGYDTYFSKVLYGPLAREYPVNNGTWLLSYVTLPYSYPGSLNPLPANETYEYKLGEAFLVSLEGDVAIVMISYKDVGNTSIPLDQYWSHIHKGLDGLRINVLPSANLSPTEMLGLLTGNSSLADLQYYANQIGSFQSNVYLYINGTNVGSLSSWWLWQVLYYNSQATPLVLTYSGYYNSTPFSINVYVLSNAIQVVTNAQGLSNASGSSVDVDDSLLSIQHPAVVLSPGQQITLYYVIAFNTTLSPGELQELYSEAQTRLLPLVQYPNVSSPPSRSSSPGYVKYTLILYNNTLLPGNVAIPGNGRGPDSIAYDPSNGYLYVAIGDLGVIYVVSPNNRVVANISLGPWIEAIAYDPSNGYIYVADGSTDSILVINPANNAIIMNISLTNSTPEAFAYDPSNGYLYVATWTGIIYAINPQDYVSSTIRGRYWTNSIAYDPSNGYLYAAGSAFYVVDPQNNSVIGNITYPAWTYIGAIAYDPSNGYIYVADYYGQGDSLQIVDPQNNSVIGSVSGVVGGGLTAIAYDPSNGYLYVTDLWSNSVYVIDSLNNTAIANITVGYLPYAVAYNPSNNEMYVVNGESDTLSIIVTPQNATPQTYHVTFVEYGLPNGTWWSVDLNGTTRWSNTSSITFNVTSGVYYYTVSPVDGYVPSPSSGTIVVTSQNVTVYVNFTSTSITVNVFNVNGKPASTVPGVVYGVLVNSSGAQVGVQYMNYNSQIVFENVVPGTYTLYIYHYPNTGLNETEYWGSLTISVAGGRNETYDFVRDMPYIDNISAYPLGNGTYLVKVLIINPQNASISGVVTVYISSQENLSGPGPQALTQSTVLSHGLNTVDITYSQSQPGMYYAYVVLQSYVQQPLGQPVVTDQYNWTELIQIGYSVTFNETGLPPGTSWSVTLNGTTRSSTSSTITFVVPPGVYYYNVSPVPGYYATPSAGSIDVNGSNVTVHVTFTPKTFIMTGDAVFENNGQRLVLTSDSQDANGAVFWGAGFNGEYLNLTVRASVQYSASVPGDGLVLYLFVSPSGWGVEPQYNYSVPGYETSLNISPVMGDVFLPRSSSPYVVVQWDPVWQNAYRRAGAVGQWNVWVVYPNGESYTIEPSFSNLGGGYEGWDGIGVPSIPLQELTGQASVVEVSVFYNASDDVLVGFAVDNVGGWSMFALNLSGYFNPPSDGFYVFGVGAATGYYYGKWYLYRMNDYNAVYGFVNLSYAGFNGVANLLKLIFSNAINPVGLPNGQGLPSSDVEFNFSELAEYEVIIDVKSVTVGDVTYTPVPSRLVVNLTDLWWPLTPMYDYYELPSYDEMIYFLLYMHSNINEIYHIDIVFVPYGNQLGLVEEWNPFEDMYSYENYGTSYSPNGSCYGFSSTALLYFERYQLGMTSVDGLVVPYYPLQDYGPTTTPSSTAQLYLGFVNGSNFLLISPSQYPLTPAALEIYIHQYFGLSIFALPYEYTSPLPNDFYALENVINEGQPALLAVYENNGKDGHAVIAWGYAELEDGSYAILISDPDYPGSILVALYNTQDGSFTYSWPNSNTTFTEFYVIQPEPAQWSWFTGYNVLLTPPIPWYIMKSMGGYTIVVVYAGSPVLPVNAKVEVKGVGFDTFTQWGDTQSFYGGIPGSTGVFDGDVEVFAVPEYYSNIQVLADPPNGTGVFVMRVGNSSIVSYLVNLTSAGSMNVTLSLTPSGLTVRSNSTALANVSAAYINYTAEVVRSVAFRVSPSSAVDVNSSELPQGVLTTNSTTTSTTTITTTTNTSTTTTSTITTTSSTVTSSTLTSTTTFIGSLTSSDAELLALLFIVIVAAAAFRSRGRR